MSKTSVKPYARGSSVDSFASSSQWSDSSVAGSPTAFLQDPWISASLAGTGSFSSLDSAAIVDPRSSALSAHSSRRRDWSTIENFHRSTLEYNGTSTSATSMCISGNPYTIPSMAQTAYDSDIFYSECTENGSTGYAFGASGCLGMDLYPLLSVAPPTSTANSLFTSHYHPSLDYANTGLCLETLSPVYLTIDDVIATPLDATFI